MEPLLSEWAGVGIAALLFCPILIYGFFNARRRARHQHGLLQGLGLAPDLAWDPANPKLRVAYRYSGSFRGIPVSLEHRGGRRGSAVSGVLHYVAPAMAPMPRLVVLARGVYEIDLERLGLRADLMQLPEMPTGDRFFDAAFRTVAFDPGGAQLLSSPELRSALLALRAEARGLLFLETGPKVHIAMSTYYNRKSFWTPRGIAEPLELVVALASPRRT